MIPGWLTNIVPILILSTVTAIIMLLHGIHWSQWRAAVLLALAGVTAGFLVVVVKFQPVQHAVFPFRYEAVGAFMGNQTWRPHDAPAWLLSLADRGRVVQTPSEYIDELFHSLPPGTSVFSNTVTSPGHLPGVAYYDPNFVCGVPGAEPRDPSTVPGVIIYRGVRALLYYAQNALPWGGVILVFYGTAIAFFALCLRRLHRSARMRIALTRGNRTSILVRAAWWSIAWPAAAVLARAFFFDLYMASSSRTRLVDGVLHQIAPTAPLALGRAGIGAIWLGTILGSILTFYCVALRAAARQADSSDAEIICDACGYPVADPHDRCPECGTPREADAPNRRNLWQLAHTPLLVALWLLVGLLLCAPLTLPLLGALLPSPVVDAIGQSWYQLPWATQREIIPSLSS